MTTQTQDEILCIITHIYQFLKTVHSLNYIVSKIQHLKNLEQDQ